MSAPAYQASCDNCGAPMTYDPTTAGLACDHCKAEKALAVTAVGLLPYDSWRQRDDATEEVFQVTCEGCGASTTLPPRVTTGTCPFCAQTFVAPPSAVQRIRPGGVLPMSVAHPKAVEAYKAWIGSRWFAPNDLKASAVAGAFAAVHVPSWRFDAHASTAYRGERGEDRTEWYTETYTDSEGKSQTRQASRTVTDWYSANGVAEADLARLMITGTTTLTEKEQDELRPWPLEEIVGYDPGYLLGSATEESAIDVDQAWTQARAEGDDEVESSVKRDIGGDHQRIHKRETSWSAIAFMAMLLPIWVAAYTYRGETYRVLVNGRTGKVWGRRPYSPIKIALAVLAAVAVIAVIVFVAMHNRSTGATTPPPG